MTKYNFKTKPFKHQLKALEKSQGKQCFAYFMEMGTGKTKDAIDDDVNLYLEILDSKKIYRSKDINKISVHDVFKII